MTLCTHAAINITLLNESVLKGTIFNYAGLGYTEAPTELLPDGSTANVVYRVDDDSSILIMAGSFQISFPGVGTFTVTYTYNNIDSTLYVIPGTVFGSQLKVAQEHDKSIQGSNLMGRIRFYNC